MEKSKFLCPKSLPKCSINFVTISVLIVNATVVNLAKHSTIINYGSRVVLSRKLLTLRLYSCNLEFKNSPGNFSASASLQSWTRPFVSTDRLATSSRTATRTATARAPWWSLATARRPATETRETFKWRMASTKKMKKWKLLKF